MKKLITNNFLLITYLILSVFSVLPFFSGGFFTFHDDVQVARIYEMAISITSWQFPVRWVPDLGYGLGYPIFNFYSVLPYYIGGVLSAVGMDVLYATKLVFVIGIMLSGVSMYYLTKEFFGKLPALVSSIIYLYFPYHAVNIYVRGALAELFAYALLPLVFLSLYKIHQLRTFNKGYVVLGSLSIAAVILSHNLTSYMLLIFIIPFVMYSIISNRERKPLPISYGIVLLIAFSLSAFYAVPALLESKYTNVMLVIGGGSNPIDHFVCPGQLWDSMWGYGGSAPGCIDGMSFKLGKLNIILLAAAAMLLLIGWKRFKEKTGIVVFSVLGFIFSVFMTLELSSFLWSLPYMEFLQFPWRFLNFTGLFTSFLVGILVWLVSERYSKQTAVIVTILIILTTVIMNKGLFNPQANLPKSSADYTNNYYLNWTASKISDEYLPKDFVRPISQKDILNSMNSFNDSGNGLYTKTPDGSGFEFGQTQVQTASNLLSLVGVIALIAVIIVQPGSIYGKKTS